MHFVLVMVSSVVVGVIAALLLLMWLAWQWPALDAWLGRWLLDRIDAKRKMVEYSDEE